MEPGGGDEETVSHTMLASVFPSTPTGRKRTPPLRSRTGGKGKRTARPLGADGCCSAAFQVVGGAFRSAGQGYACPECTQEFSTWKKLTSHRQQKGHAVVSCSHPGCEFVTVAARSEMSRGKVLMSKHLEDHPGHAAAGFTGAHSMLSLYELQAPLTPYVKSAFDEKRCVFGESRLVAPARRAPARRAPAPVRAGDGYYTPFPVFLDGSCNPFSRLPFPPGY